MLDKTKWVIVASRTAAKIFEHDELTTKLKCLQVITNLAGRQHSRLFGQDRLGARKGKLSGKNSSQDGGKNPHEHAAEKFALQIAESVTKSFHENRFIRAVIFAEPHFLGLIKQHLHPRVSPHIEWIGKDLAKASTPALELQISEI